LLELLQAVLCPKLELLKTAVNFFRPNAFPVIQQHQNAERNLSTAPTTENNQWTSQFLIHQLTPTEKHLCPMLAV